MTYDPHCYRCGHPSSWHSHDAKACLACHVQPCEPDNEPRRCNGVNPEKPGLGLRECYCPSFVGDHELQFMPREELLEVVRASVDRVATVRDGSSAARLAVAIVSLGALAHRDESVNS